MLLRKSVLAVFNLLLLNVVYSSDQLSLEPKDVSLHLPFIKTSFVDEISNIFNYIQVKARKRNLKYCDLLPMIVKGLYEKGGIICERTVLDGLCHRPSAIRPSINGFTDWPHYSSAYQVGYLPILVAPQPPPPPPPSPSFGLPPFLPPTKCPSLQYTPNYVLPTSKPSKLPPNIDRPFPMPGPMEIPSPRFTSPEPRGPEKPPPVPNWGYPPTSPKLSTPPLRHVTTTPPPKKSLKNSDATIHWFWNETPTHRPQPRPYVSPTSPPKKTPTKKSEIGQGLNITFSGVKPPGNVARPSPSGGISEVFNFTFPEDDKKEVYIVKVDHDEHNISNSHKGIHYPKRGKPPFNLPKKNAVPIASRRYRPNFSSPPVQASYNTAEHPKKDIWIGEWSPPAKPSDAPHLSLVDISLEKVDSIPGKPSEIEKVYISTVTVPPGFVKGGNDQSYDWNVNVMQNRLPQPWGSTVHTDVPQRVTVFKRTTPKPRITYSESKPFTSISRINNFKVTRRPTVTGQTNITQWINVFTRTSTSKPLFQGPVYVNITHSDSTGREFKVYKKGHEGSILDYLTYNFGKVLTSGVYFTITRYDGLPIGANMLNAYDETRILEKTIIIKLNAVSKESTTRQIDITKINNVEFRILANETLAPMMTVRSLIKKGIGGFTIATFSPSGRRFIIRNGRLFTCNGKLSRKTGKCIGSETEFLKSKVVNNCYINDFPRAAGFVCLTNNAKHIFMTYYSNRIVCETDADKAEFRDYHSLNEICSHVATRAVYIYYGNLLGKCDSKPEKCNNICKPSSYPSWKKQCVLDEDLVLREGSPNLLN